MRVVEASSALLQLLHSVAAVASIYAGGLRGWFTLASRMLYRNARSYGAYVCAYSLSCMRIRMLPTRIHVKYSGKLSNQGIGSIRMLRMRIRMLPTRIRVKYSGKSSNQGI